MNKKRANHRMVNEDDPRFAAFWDAYPKRVAKKDARKAWFDIAPTDAQVVLMIAALEWQREQPGWLKDGGQYIPYPAGWLRDERWTDEAPKPTKPTTPPRTKMMDLIDHNADVFAQLTGRKAV